MARTSWAGVAVSSVGAWAAGVGVARDVDEDAAETGGSTVG